MHRKLAVVGYLLSCAAWAYSPVDMSSKAEIPEAGCLPEPDKELTSALEQVHRVYGGDLASFFERLRDRRLEKDELFKWADSNDPYPAEALARCSSK